jgi:hypothetical protein
MRVWMRRGVGVWVWVCVFVCGRWCWMCVCCVFGDGGVVHVSLSYNDLGAEGGAAMAGAVQHLTSLTTLKYV